MLPHFKIKQLKRNLADNREKRKLQINATAQVSHFNPIPIDDEYFVCDVSIPLSRKSREKVEKKVFGEMVGLQFTPPKEPRELYREKRRNFYDLLLFSSMEEQEEFLKRAEKKIGFGKIQDISVDDTAWRTPAKRSKTDDPRSPFFVSTYQASNAPIIFKIRFVFVAPEVPAKLRKYLYDIDYQWKKDDMLVLIQHPEICEHVRQSFLDLTGQ